MVKSIGTPSFTRQLFTSSSFIKVQNEILVRISFNYDSFIEDISINKPANKFEYRRETW